MHQVKKEKILFFAPSHFNIDQVLLYHLNQLENVEVISLNKKYEYTNIAQRAYNLLIKIFFKTPPKKKWLAQIQINQIKENKVFHKCLIFRPDLLHEDVLEFIKKNIPIRKVVYWDSFEKIPKLKTTISYFNDFYSFEAKDCKKYGFKTNSNFYIQKPTNKKPAFDFFFFGAKDARFNNIKKVILYLTNKNFKSKALLIGKQNKIMYNGTIELSKNKVPFFECYTFSENTKIVVDISHKNQKGLSMRPYEALGLKKKLLTNNINIKNYDFYNSNNIFIIEDINHIYIPEYFFNSPYEDIPEDIYDKYHINEWLRNLLK